MGKIVLSRKGFDSATGKIPSAIINGMLVSFPIPNDLDEKDSYDSIVFDDKTNSLEKVKYSKIINDLYEETNKRRKVKLKLKKHCHVDPDLKQIRQEEIDNWEPIFGQSGQSASYLINQSNMINGNLVVENNDLFLFFGTYRDVTYENGRYKYKTNAVEKHVIWGWMVVKEKITNPSKNKYEWHPHTYDENVAWEDKNVLFIGYNNCETVEFNGIKIPGSGVFKYSEARVLTENGFSKSNWKIHDIYKVDNIKRKTKNNSSKCPNKTICYSGQWQELLLNDCANNEAKKWIETIFEDTKIKE